MTVQFLLATAIRWAGLAALATLVGSLVVDALVLPREPSEVSAVRGRLRQVGVICLIVLAGTTAGELVTRSMLLDHCWDESYEGLSNLVDVHVSRVRRKVDTPGRKPLFHTIRGAGFILGERPS